MYKIGGAPIIYFVDDNGQKWEIDHIFDNNINIDDELLKEEEVPF